MNFPNKLTIFRIVLVPIICLVWLFPYETFGVYFSSMHIGMISISYLNIIVGSLFAIASLSDFFDGYIARKNGTITTFGKFADPIADKLLVNMMLIVLSYKKMIPVVPCILMVLRDIVVDGCRMIAAQNGVVVSAGILGKLKTALEMISIILVLLNNLPFEFYNIPADEILIWFTSFVSVAGGYSYFMQLKEYIFKTI